MHVTWKITFFFPSIVICRGCQIFCVKLYWIRHFSAFTRKNYTFLKNTCGEKKKSPFKFVSVEKLHFFPRENTEIYWQQVFLPNIFPDILLFLLVCFFFSNMFVKPGLIKWPHIMNFFHQYTVPKYFLLLIEHISIFPSVKHATKLWLFGKCERRCNCSNRSIQMLPGLVIAAHILDDILLINKKMLY